MGDLPPPAVRRRGGGAVSGATVDAGQALNLGARHHCSSGNLDELDLPGFRQLVERRPTDAQRVAGLINAKRQLLVVYR